MRKIDPLENDIRVLKDLLNAKFDYLNDRIRQLEHPAKYKKGDRVFYVRDRPRILEVDFVWFDDGWVYDLRLENTPSPIRIYSKVREEDLLSEDDVRGLCDSIKKL